MLGTCIEYEHQTIKSANYNLRINALQLVRTSSDNVVKLPGLDT